MFMKNLFFWGQVTSSLALIFLISIQTKGFSLGRSFNQSSSVAFKRRGIEKMVFKLTLFFSCLFLVSSILRIFFA